MTTTHPPTETSINREHTTGPTVCWLIPDKPDNISTGRNRIADGLEARGIDVIRRVDRRRQFRRQFRDWERFDVFMASSAAGGLFGPPAKLLQRRAFIMDHVDPIRQMYRTASRRKAHLANALQWAGFLTADGVLYVYDEEERRVRVNGARVEQTTLGVDYGRFQHPEKDEQLVNRLRSLGTEPGCAVYIGGLEPIYNIETMIRAAGRTDRDLVIAGCGSKENMVRTAAETTESIQYLGVVDHDRIPTLLGYAGVGICLVDDPHTVKTLEYAAAGLHIVHIQGRAQGVVPDSGVTWVPTDHAVIADAIDHPGRMNSGKLRSWAADHDYEQVVDQYERMVRAVV